MPLVSSAITGGEGQYTQWVHCELIVGFETIHPANTQQVSGGRFQKVPTLGTRTPVLSQYMLIIC